MLHTRCVSALSCRKTKLLSAMCLVAINILFLFLVLFGAHILSFYE